MRVFTAFAFILFALGLTGADVVADPARSATWWGTPLILAGPTLDDSTVITLERGPCFGHCSEYVVTLYGSGRVEFEGRHYVCARGHQTVQASPDEVRDLVARMLKLGYLDLYWREGPRETIAPTVRTSLRYNGQTRQIDHHSADINAPWFLRTLEEQIDAVAGTWRWLPEREDHRRVCRLEDGITTEPLEVWIINRGGTR